MADSGNIPVNPLGPTNPINPTGPAPSDDNPVTPSINDTRSWSSLTKAEQDEVIQLLSAYAYQPVLVNPTWESGTAVDPSVISIVASVESKFAEIGAKMWDDYIKNLGVIKEQIDEIIRSPNHQQQVEAANPLSIKRMLDHNETIIAGMTDYINNHKNDHDAIPFMAMAFVVAAGVIGASISVVNVASTSMVAVNPIVDAANIATQVLPSTLADSSAMVINLFLPAMLYSTSFTVANSLNGGKGQKEVDLTYARDYAKNVLGKVNGNEINQFLSAVLVHKYESGEPISKEQLSQAANITKLVMLSVAFALFYKVETGWLTGTEFANFIKENPYKEGTVEYDLINTIRQYLSMIPPDDRTTTLEELMAYCDRNPNVDELLNPEKAFSKIFNGINRGIDAA